MRFLRHLLIWLVFGVQALGFGIHFYLMADGSARFSETELLQMIGATQGIPLFVSLVFSIWLCNTRWAKNVPMDRKA